MMTETSICGESKSESKVILVSCSGMCVHGQVSREAVHNVIYEKAVGKTNWVCPTAIPLNIGWQINRLKNAKAIVAVPGCPVHCDVKLLQAAGFAPTVIVDAHEVCHFAPNSMELTDIPVEERKNLVNKLAKAIEQVVVKLS